MKQTIGIAAAWIGATVLAIVIAAAGIASVRSQVTEAPTPLGSPSALAVAGSVAATTTTAVGPTTTLVVDPTAASTTSAPSTSVPGSSTTTALSGASSTTTPPVATSKNYTTAGGTVTISVANPNVTFTNAVPNSGWKVEVEDFGPDKVKVKFERNDDSEDEIEFVAKFESGELKVTIEDH
jgi:hypothetical protein